MAGLFGSRTVADTIGYEGGSEIIANFLAHVPFVTIESNFLPERTWRLKILPFGSLPSSRRDEDIPKVRKEVVTLLAVLFAGLRPNLCPVYRNIHSSSDNHLDGRVAPTFAYFP